MENVNYLMAQASRNLRIDNVNPCDSALLPHHQPIRELCMS